MNVTGLEIELKKRKKTRTTYVEPSFNQATSFGPKLGPIASNRKAFNINALLGLVPNNKHYINSERIKVLNKHIMGLNLSPPLALTIKD